MSVNQSRGDKNEPPHYRRSGRSANPASQRNFSGGGGGGKGGGGGTTTAPPSSSSFYSGKSFKKVVTNAPGPQTRVPGPNPNVNSGPLNPPIIGRAAVQNGAHIQPPIRGTPDASTAGVTIKPTDSPVQKSTPGLPKAPQSNTIPPSSANPSTPAKGPADASRGFPLQFGSISPGVMNGMQVPARTNSAPPNMDEQKRAQARLDSLKATSYQNPPVPKQHIPRKDAGPVDQSNTSDPHHPTKDKKDVTPPVTVPSHIQKPTGPPMPNIPGVPMQIPFHQPQLHLQFGGPNPQLQSQGIANTPMQVPLPMHLGGNPPQVQQQVFVPGMQQYPMSSQGIMHPNQGLSFSNQMGPQIGNMGMGLGPQYQPQQIGTFGGAARRTSVKITHPDTHEELRLDKRGDTYPNGGSAGPRAHPHGPPQSQQIPTFQPGHPMNYYQNQYNPNPMYYQPPGANPLTSQQTTSGPQAPRFYNQHVSKQVTVKPAISAPVEKVADSSSGKSEIPKMQKPGGEGTSSHPRKESETVATSSKSSATPAASEDATPLVNVGTEVENKSTINKSSSSKEEAKQPDKKTEPIRVDKIGATDKDVLETSNVSKCDNNEESSKLTEIIGSETNSAKPKVEEPITQIVGSKEQSEDSVDQNKDTTVPDVIPGAQEKEPVNIIDSKSSEQIFTPEVDVVSAETSSLSLESSHDHKTSSLDDNKDSDHVDNKESVTINEEPREVSVSVPETTPLTLDVSISPSSSGSIDKSFLDTSKGKANTPKGKKKIRDILKNADARGSTSDLYNAYKRPEEKKESSSAEVTESSSDISSNTKRASVDSVEKPVKVEPEDWEDVADISTPKLEGAVGGKRILSGLKPEDNDGTTKKYSRDFLLKFADHCTDLPEGFEITNDNAEALVGSGDNVHRNPYPSPGRGGDRSAGGLRLDRRGSNVSEDHNWNKGPRPVGQGRDVRLDMRFGGNQGGFQRGNHGVLQTPRGQTPGQYGGGLLSGPMQSPGQQGNMNRNNSDSGTWQHATGYQRGLIPSPQTPMMHKAERKYEVGKITDEEQAKQRQLKGILNKLTPQNFEKLFEQVKQVNIDNAGTLSGVIGQIFDKALMEPTFVEMYANFCSRLSVELPDFSENEEKITFKRLLLNKCQEEFERGEREQEEANRTEEEGEVKQTEEQREEKRVKARRRMLGNIRLIGELYKKKMLTERIMHSCINKLLGQYQNPDEEDIESLCKLMSTIGEMIDHPKAREHMEAYFGMMFKLSNNMQLSSRVRFMLKDVIDLRKNRWQQRRKVEGPKKIEEVHRDAAQERQAQSNRLARGPNPNMGSRRGQGQGQNQPVDFGPKGSNVLSSGGYRGLPQQQARGYGNQDSRFEERHAFETRTLSVPLRPSGDESITLGPQGGLARGMSVRGQGPPVHEMQSPDPRRAGPGPGPNGSGYGSHDPRNTARGFDRVPPSPRGRVSTPPQTGSCDKVLSEDRLHELSMTAIKEFYSARDEKEVALCIKELNAPGFYPTMISVWVTDSFERKDMERESLAKLLVNLSKVEGGLLSQDAFVKGFESVLSTLEDAVNDAPKAAEFLGRIIAKMLLENVIPYKETWHIILVGGEEQGSLVETGLAAEVLGVILEIIKSEKGDPFLNEIRANSNLRLESFRPPPTYKKPSRLDKFV